ncbi:MAG: hypothetical protein ACFFC7_04670 [Candidatus Hermodarchaeota archaeon]
MTNNNERFLNTVIVIISASIKKQTLMDKARAIGKASIQHVDELSP